MALQGTCPNCSNSTLIPDIGPASCDACGWFSDDRHIERLRWRDPDLYWRDPNKMHPEESGPVWLIWAGDPFIGSYNKDKGSNGQFFMKAYAPSTPSNMFGSPFSGEYDKLISPKYWAPIAKPRFDKKAQEAVLLAAVDTLQDQLTSFVRRFEKKTGVDVFTLSVFRGKATGTTVNVVLRKDEYNPVGSYMVEATEEDIEWAKNEGLLDED